MVSERCPNFCRFVVIISPTPCRLPTPTPTRKPAPTSPPSSNASTTSSRPSPGAPCAPTVPSPENSKRPRGRWGARWDGTRTVRAIASPDIGSWRPIDPWGDSAANGGRTSRRSRGRGGCSRRRGSGSRREGGGGRYGRSSSSNRDGNRRRRPLRRRRLLTTQECQSAQRGGRHRATTAGQLREDAKHRNTSTRRPKARSNAKSSHCC
ncbi:hypothetical protein ACHAWF_001688 [Thalassiosira exigua]